MSEIAWTIVLMIIALPLFVLFIMECYSTWTGIPVECEIDVPLTDRTIVIRVKGFK